MHLDTEAFKNTTFLKKKDITLLVLLMQTEQWECVIYIVGGQSIWLNGKKKKINWWSNETGEMS